LIMEAVVAVVASIASSGPPEKRGIFDAIDVALGHLTEHRREVLLLRFGGTGEAPLTQVETAKRTGHSASRLGQIQKKALANVRAFAGPGFACELRELERRVIDRGADLAEQLSPVGRSSSEHEDRPPWDLPTFYVGLLVALAPGLAAASPAPRGVDLPAASRSSLTGEDLYIVRLRCAA
jgi:Sigma-70, region 4